MTSKEIIRRLVAHDAPPRFGYDFNDGTCDFVWTSSRTYINLAENPYDAWGNYPALKKLTGFSGEVRRDRYGNIYGRFNGKTKGECIRGAIEDWEDYSYPLPEFDPGHRDRLLAHNFAASEKFVLCGGNSLFSTLRDARLMSNALADTITDPDAVYDFIDRLAEHEIAVIKNIAGCGIDGWFLGDDWGTQDRTFISPDSFRRLFKPSYKKIADAAHEAGMCVFLHSCGYIYAFLEDFIDAGIDVFQFDQPDAYPTETLAREFGRRAVFHSPVDIQKVLPTGDRAVIETRAREMCEAFRSVGGGWIAKDYPTYHDIGVQLAWAKWAQDVIVANSRI
ncbi:MAG: uroporphyrinogen decarboxylase family protein [Eubacteriales bacterium]